MPEKFAWRGTSHLVLFTKFYYEEAGREKCCTLGVVCSGREVECTRSPVRLEHGMENNVKMVIA
jgi:hypothetical protein